MKLFISADIEGTAGIVSWKETQPGDQYGYFAGQMTRAAAMTGYHTCAGSDGNPLAHTMNPGVEKVLLNGTACSEFTINALYAAYMAVSVIFQSGDEMVCGMAKELCPGIITVAATRGIGGGAVGLHPEEAREQIGGGMERAVRRLKEQLKDGKASDCRIRLPEHFTLDVHYREHKKAYRASFYPGAVKKRIRSIYHCWNIALVEYR